MRAIIFIIWIIDILNIGTNINGFNLAEFLDVTLQINTVAWILIFIFLPAPEYVVHHYNHY